MNKKSVAIAMQKARMMKKQGKMAVKIIDGDMAEREGRMLIVDANEIGIQSSKTGAGDKVRYIISGKVISKGDGKFRVRADNVSVHEEEKRNERTIPPPIVSPSG